MKRKYLISFILIFLVLIIIAGINSYYQNKTSDTSLAIMYKSEGCLCCVEYSKYLNSHGISVKINIVEINSFMDKYNIPKDLRSCHFIIFQGYIIIGHVPIEAINKLLSEKPKIRGISLPGMPSGSPGMNGVKTEEFIIYSFDFNGNISIFMRI
jgi:hypothetical protein